MVCTHYESKHLQIPHQNTTPNSDWTFRTGLTGLRTGLTALDRSDRSDRIADLTGGIIFSSGVQIGRSIYAFRLSRRDLRNGIVHLVIWQTYLDQSDQFRREVWPVCPDCPANLMCANFGCQQIDAYANSLGFRIILTVVVSCSWLGFGLNF